MNPHPDLFKMDILFEYNLGGIHLHMGYTYLTDLAPPKKLHRSLGTDLPYIPQWVIIQPVEEVRKEQLR